MRDHPYIKAPPEPQLYRLDRTFASAVGRLHEGLTSLLTCEPFEFATRPGNLPHSAVYLFAEGTTPLYVGRTDSFPFRLEQHCQAGRKNNQASFAFQLAKEAAAAVDPAPPWPAQRAKLEVFSAFVPLFAAAKQRVSLMSVRYVEEKDEVTQALLEVYCAIALKTPYNSFANH